MSAIRVRTYVSLPRELLDEIDALVGEDGRSEFIEEAVIEQLRRRRRLLAAMDAVAATPPVPGVPPEWDEPGGPARWVHELRHTKSARERRLEALQREDCD